MGVQLNIEISQANVATDFRLCGRFYCGFFHS